MDNFEPTNGLSEAELKFLASCKEKMKSTKILETIFSEKMTLSNYENIFLLKEYEKVGGTINPEQAVRNIRYRDKHGTIIAIVQIDTINKKIRMQNLGDFLPKQESFTLEQINTKLKNLAKYNSWTTEDGGTNQFNGNLEYRYKNKDGNVTAAIITKLNGGFDTIAEYEYNDSGYRTRMLLTNHFGQSLVVYDGSASVIQQTRVDIDSDGTIVEVTKLFSN